MNKKQTNKKKNSDPTAILDVLAMIFTALALIACVFIFDELKTYRQELTKTQEKYEDVMQTINEDSETINDLEKILKDCGIAQ